MSRRIDTRYAAKRRAANRKRVREYIRYIAIFGFIGILILGTVSTVLVTTAPTTSTVAGSPTATSANSAALADLVTKGDASIATGDYNGGLSYYLAYSSQNPTDADVMFKIGKAYVDSKNPSPDYLAGVAYLQRAVNASPSATWVAEAAGLITQYQDKAAADATSTAVSVSQAVTGTATLTGTTGAPSITATTVITK